MVSRGEVWWAAPTGGKRRPYLIVQRDASIPHVRRVLAMPATRTVRGIPTEVELDEQDGMPAVCALTADNLALIDLAAFEERICVLGPRRMADACRAIRIATGCD